MIGAFFQRWHDRPLGFKLAAVLALGAGLAALSATVAMLAIAWWSAEAHAREDAHENVRSLAFALQAPVAFVDDTGIREAVAVLKSRPQVVGAWVVDAAGGPLYSFGEQHDRGYDEAGGLWAGWIQVSAPIRANADSEEIGWVTLHIDLGEVLHGLRVQAAAAAGGALAALLLAVLISRRLARGLTAPVVALAQTATAIARDQHFDRRLLPAGADEVGVAVQAFNRMLDEVQRRGDALSVVNRELQQQARDSQDARRLAEAASLAKTRFLANMSHELRSPLNGVIGAAQLLQAQGADAGRRSELVDIIRTSGTNLLGLIEGVLDLARIEAGALRITEEEFNLGECIDAAVMSSAAVAAAKGLRLDCIIDPALAPWRRGDGHRLRQLLLNLLGNAVKFTARGEVIVEVQAGASPDELRIEVRDTGIGIEAKALAAIFAPFQQADDTTTRRFGGSGLGLAICRELVQLMGGRIEVRSAPGEGSSFTLWLPLPPVSAPPAAPAPLGLRVAWFEPHPPSARALQALLQRLGCVEQACTDLGSLQRFMAEPDALGRRPWLMVATDTDEGRALLAQAQPWLDAAHVIPMGASAVAADALACDAAGVPRPVARPVLRAAMVSRLAEGRGLAASSAEAGARAADTGAGRLVLVVEDDGINQSVVRAMLLHAGFRCQVAAHGHGALLALSEQAFDAVLMDWQMPDMDGLEATRRLRAGEAGTLNLRVPVIALTANAFAEDRQACLAAGMDDFLTKPVLAAQLTEVVSRWAGRQSSSLPVAVSPRADAPAAVSNSAGAPAAHASPADAPAAVSTPASAPSRPVPPPTLAAEAGEPPAYDPSLLASLPMVADGSDPGCADALLAQFADSLPTTLARLEDSLARGDAATHLRLMHTLKSSAGQVGALALAAVADRHETAQRRGAAPDARALPQLRAEVRRFEAAIGRPVAATSAESTPA